MDSSKRLTKLDQDVMVRCQLAQKSLTLTLSLQKNFAPSRVFSYAVNATPSSSEQEQGRPQLTSVSFDHNGEHCLIAGEDEAFSLWNVQQAVYGLRY